MILSISSLCTCSTTIFFSLLTLVSQSGTSAVHILYATVCVSRSMWMFCSAATPRGVLGTAKLNTRSSKQKQMIRPAGCFPPVLDRRLSLSSSSIIYLSFESLLLSISSPRTCPTTIFFSLLTCQSKWKHPTFRFGTHAAWSLKWCDSDVIDVNVLQCCHPSRRVGHCKV